MTTYELILQNWHLNIFALIITTALIIFHIVTNQYKLTRKSIYFFSGVSLFILSTFSSLDFLGRNYLFSAHMIEHIIILLVIPPLLLTGTSKEFLSRVFSKPKAAKFGNIIFNPIVAWFLGVGSMWFWHIPYFFRLMKSYPSIHLIQMISLLVLGIIFIWPVFTPIKLRKLEPLNSSLYLFSACVGCTVLGIFITFAPAGMYTAYYYGSNKVVLNMIQNDWGITPDIDQQMGGLIMWVPACIVYLTNILITLSKWYNIQEVENSDEILLHKG